VFLADVINDVAPLTNTRCDRMLVVGVRHNIRSIWYLANGASLMFNLDRICGDAGLEFVGRLVIAGPQYFLSQDETNGLQPVVEFSEQSFAVIDECAVLSEKLEHHVAKGAFARTMPSALEHDHGPRMLVGILYRPSVPAHEIFELRFIASADDFPNMTQQAPLLLPSFLRLDAEAMPKVELV